MKLEAYLSGHSDLKSLYALVEGDFATKGLIHHNWNHVLRDLAKGIMVGEVENANMKIVLAGVLLHDTGRLHPEEDEDHHVAGGKIAPKYLSKAGFTRSEIEEVVHCIRSHGARGAEEPETLEARVCYDVSVLSCSCGNIGVARVFHFFIAESQFSVRQMMEIPSGRKGPRKSFYTQTGRKMGHKGYLKAKRFWTDLDEGLKREEQRVRKIIPEYRGD